MRVSDIMTQEVVSIAPDATVAEAAQLMIKERISGLPVIDGQRHLIGIITEGDLLRRSETGTQGHRPRWLQVFMSPHRLAAEYVHSHSNRVADLMTADVAVAHEDAALADVVEIMQRRQINRVPIVRNQLVVGIVTRANLLHALAGSPPRPTSADDRQIRKDIVEELGRHKWAAKQLEVAVRGGVVDLWGLITDEGQRDAIHVAIENVAGVRKIRDHLLWVAGW